MYYTVIYYDVTIFAELKFTVEKWCEGEVDSSQNETSSEYFSTTFAAVYDIYCLTQRLNSQGNDKHLINASTYKVIAPRN